MITLRTSITGAVLALGLASAGCVSVLPEQPKPEAVYRLPDPQTRVELETNVVIREPDAPRLLAVRKITSQGPDGGFKVLPGVAWADRATRMFQVTLLDAFSTSGNGLAVDDVTGVSGTYEVYWRVSQFSLDGGEGVCQLELTLLDGGSREPVAQHTVSASSPASARDDLARAIALADAGRQCVERAATFIAERAVAPESEDISDESL